ncbi:hypothetical protein [Haladaptatus sp. DYF46]|uniref:hypothetical protein n=1 Tax=Haladaptatus sp. DYF46 TaxID=2886041 RepID=UPI001E507659|nr:hypothetical protein [Haladaptatus sp. DYF46]
MSRLTRRKTLQLGGAAFTAGLAGCSAFGEQSPTPLLGKLEAVNHDRRPHTLHALFLDDGNPVYWVSKEIPAADESGPGFARFEEYPTEPDGHALHVRVEDQPKSDWEQFDFDQPNTTCYGFLLSVGSKNGSPFVDIWQTTGTLPCEGVRTMNESE